MSKKVDLGIILASIIVILLAHKPLALGAMGLVDNIGTHTGLNVIELIDVLNDIYYL